MSLFPVVIETDRLRLERLARDRLDPLELYEHVREGAPHVEEVTRYLSWDPHGTPKDTLEFFDRVDQQWTDEEGATYAVRPREGEDGGARSASEGRAVSESEASEPRDGAGELAGTTGLSIDWERRTGTLGIWLRKPFWGRGYSGERASALMELAFDRLDLELVAVEHLAGNENSRRAIERYVEAHGGRHEGLLRNHHSGDDGPRDAHRYSVAREEYREAAGHDTAVRFVDE